MALLTINTTDLPVPTVLQPGIQDLDSEDGTGRNQSGTMFRDRVAVKRSVHCEWGPLTKDEVSTLLSAMSGVSFSLTYPDPQEGALKTITAYVGDRSTPMLLPIGENDWMWGGLSADFVEM
jgi:hypothetical protein